MLQLTSFAEPKKTMICPYFSLFDCFSLLSLNIFSICFSFFSFFSFFLSSFSILLFRFFVSVSFFRFIFNDTEHATHFSTLATPHRPPSPQVAKTASKSEIQKAYYRLARQYHPDKNPDDATAEERFKEVADAYQVLADTEKREKFDRFVVIVIIVK